MVEPPEHTHVWRATAWSHRCRCGAWERLGPWWRRVLGAMLDIGGPGW